MIKNILFVIIVWVVSLFLQSLITNYYNNLAPDFLVAAAFSILMINKSRFSILVILLFSLTGDSLIITYAGLMSLLYMILGLIFLKYQMIFYIAGLFKNGFLIFISLFTAKICSFLVIWLLSGINLSFKLAEYEFWVSLLLSVIYSTILIGLINYLKTRENAKIFKHLLDY